MTPFLPSPPLLPPPTAIEGSPGWAGLAPQLGEAWETHGINKQAQHPVAFSRTKKPSKTNGTTGHAPPSPLTTEKLNGHFCPQTCSPPAMPGSQRHAPGLLQPCPGGCDEGATRVPPPGFTRGRWDMSRGDSGSRRRLPGRTRARVPTAGWHVPLSSRGATGQGAASPRGLFHGALGRDEPRGCRPGEIPESGSQAQPR